MKKLKKLVLNELRQKNYILSSVEQQAIQGGGSGTAQDPYTMYEFENWNGPWNGGFIDGFGFSAEGWHSNVGGTQIVYDQNR